MALAGDRAMLITVCLLLALALPALATPPNDWTWQNPLPQGNDLEAVWGRPSEPASVTTIG